jgi:ABC-type antimicrobial peptide transport system permease subunit
MLIKAIGGGLVGVLVGWVAILVADYSRIEIYNRRHGVTGLGATAGGWNFLLQLPIVAILLSAAFGIGFYATVRWATRS